MAWLIRDGDVLATIEERRPGWAAAMQGAVVLGPPAFVHTVRCGVALDLAWCVPVTLDEIRGLEVRRIRSIAARRLAAPHLRSGGLVVAPAGSFERWRLQVGDRLEVRTV